MTPLRAILALALAAGAAVAPASAEETPPPLSPKTTSKYQPLAQENLTVQTSGGEVYVRLVRPNVPAGMTVPVILTYTPYAVLYSETVTTNPWVRRGYALAVADVIGTGHSGGCWDHGGAREQASAYDLVEWLGTQLWSNGKVAMTGASYDGTTANMAAAANPPHLATIVPEVAISDWYSYSYGDGVRYTLMDPGQRQGAVIDEQGFDTPASFDFAFGMVEPRSRTQTGDAREIDHACAGQIDKAEHSVRSYEPSPAYDSYWRARGYIHDAGALAIPDGLEIPALVVGGWRDYNVKHSDSVRWFQAIPADDPLTAADEGVPFKMMLMDDIAHGLPGAGFAYDVVKHAWYDHFLYGYETNIELQRPVVSKTNDGIVRRDASWPPPGTEHVRLSFGIGSSARVGSLSTGPAPAIAPDVVVADDGKTTESDALQALGGSQPDLAWWVSAPLATDVRVAGGAALDLAATTLNATSTHFTPVLFDLGPPMQAANSLCSYAPPAEACSIARGFLNARNRNGLDRLDDLVPGEAYRARVRFIDGDWVVPQGHRIGVAVMSSNAWWAEPDAQRAVNVVHQDAVKPSALELPIVGGLTAAVAAGL